MLEENWEYVGHDLSYKEFKAQVSVYLRKAPCSKASD
jgi:hypothetical protein